MSSGGWPPSDADGFGEGGRYGDDEFGADHGQGRYIDERGYDWSEPSARSQSQGDPRARGRTDPYGQQAGYRQDAYNEAYGPGWQVGGPYGDDQRGRDGYDQGGYGQGSYGQPGFDSYGEPGYGRDGYGRDHGSDRYSGGPYGHDGYGQDGYGQAGYGGEYYGAAPGQALPAPEGFGGDRYGQESYGSTESYQAPGGYQPSDGYGLDNGYLAPSGPARPALGPGSDTGSFGSFDERDSRGSADGGWSSQQSDTGSFGQAAGHAGGYDQWHDAADDAGGWDSDDAAGHDGDWEEDADNGLLSRRFGDDDGGGRGGGRGSGRRAVRARRPKRLRGKFATIAAILAGALVLGAVADYGYERFNAWHTSRYGDYTGAGTGQVRFTVPPGAALSSLGPALIQAHVIMELRPFDSAAAAAANASHLQPGVYLLHRHMSSALVVQYLLAGGHRARDQLTIIEGTRASAIAQALAKQTGIPVSQFTEIIDHPPASLGLPSWAGGKTAEGFLFPDTYTLLPKMTALQILQMMVTEFKQKVSAINLAGVAQAKSTTPWHALIVASMIQAEAGNPSDFSKISRVVWDRLLQGMKLQFDSTVFYAMGKYGTAANAAQQNFPSPYNTYLHTGLPPGPIGNPGIAAIQAAVHASHGPHYLYFVTDTRHKPYITHFTVSYQTFLQWKQEFEG